MTTADTRMSLVPLRAGFDLVLRGYDREQVHGYVQRTEGDLRQLAAARDATHVRAEDLAARLGMAHREVASLRGQLNRICRSPIELDGLNDRLRNMVQLVREEAEELTAGAREAADEQAGELNQRRQRMEAEHRDLMATTRARLDTMTAQAEQRRRELDEQAARERDQARAETERAAAETERAARERAEQLVREATDHATKIVDDVRGQVETLNACRSGLAEQLQDVQGLLAKAEPLLRPLTDEQTPAPR